MACRGACFRGFPVRWGLHIAPSVIRSVSLHVIEACSEESLLDGCIRPCGNATGLFFTALWSQQSRSILVQEMQLGRNVDLLYGTAD